jgi:hypothetical protein
VNAAVFDTLKFVEHLEAGGFSRQQAKAAAEAFAQATSQEFATRSDIALVRADLRESELRLEARIEAIKAELIKWMFGTIVAQTGLIIAAIRFLGHG